MHERRRHRRTRAGVLAGATRAMAIPGVTQLLIGRALRDNIDLPNY